MGSRYRSRTRSERNSSLPLVLVAVFCCVTVGVGILLWERETAKADMLRIQQLRTEHSGIVVDLMRLPPDHPDRERLQQRLRKVTSEHNVILDRHPTWNKQPLDTLANTR